LAGTPRAAEILVALRRLGYVDRPSIGDHFALYKLVRDHPEGPITIHTGLDMGHVSKRDVSRIRRETKLSGQRWERALGKKLTREDYDEYLRSLPKADLVLPFWRSLFESTDRERSESEQG
jgi:hypothetical protein